MNNSRGDGGPGPPVSLSGEFSAGPSWAEASEEMAMESGSPFDNDSWEEVRARHVAKRPRSTRWTPVPPTPHSEVPLRNFEICPVIFSSPTTRLAGIHPRELQALLQEVCGTYDFSYRPLIGGDILVESSTAKCTDLLLKCTTLGLHTVTASKPASIRGAKGVLRNIDSSITTEEITTELSSYGVQAVRFLCKKSHDEDGDPHRHSVIVEFHAKEAPGKVLIFNQQLVVSPYKERSRYCTRCHRYTHGSQRCTFPVRCKRCGGEHEADGCQAMLLRPKCVNCGKAHSTNDSSCTVRIKATTVTRTVIKEQISYRDALLRKKQPMATSQQAAQYATAPTGPWSNLSDPTNFQSSRVPLTRKVEAATQTEEPFVDATVQTMKAFTSREVETSRLSIFGGRSSWLNSLDLPDDYLFTEEDCKSIGDAVRTFGRSAVKRFLRLDMQDELAFMASLFNPGAHQPDSST